MAGGLVAGVVTGGALVPGAFVAGGLSLLDDRGWLIRRPSVPSGVDHRPSVPSEFGGRTGTVLQQRTVPYRLRSHHRTT